MSRLNVYILRPRADEDGITVGMLRGMVANLDGCPDAAVLRVLPVTRWWRRSVDPDGPPLRQLVARWTS